MRAESEHRSALDTSRGAHGVRACRIPVHPRGDGGCAAPPPVAPGTAPQRNGLRGVEPVTGSRPDAPRSARCTGMRDGEARRHHPCPHGAAIRRSPTGSRDSPRTSAPPPPRRPGRRCASRPPGSGKTTTLVARAAWLIADGHAARGDPGDHVQQARRRGADRAAGRRRSRRSASRPAPSGSGRSMRSGARSCAMPGDRGGSVADRAAILRRGRPVGRRGRAAPARHRDLAAQDRARRRRPPTSPPTPTPGRSRVPSWPTRRRVGGRRRARLRRSRPRARSPSSNGDPACSPAGAVAARELLVDEVQDVDRAQLRLALLLAAPANRIFLVGDDDQSIYGWRLADVRRILGLDGALPGLRRVDLEVNYRCPRPVVERAVRLVEHNRERFAKRIRGRPGGDRAARSSRPTPSDEPVRLERAIRTWPDDGSTRAVLARTNRELLPAVVVAIGLDIPFRAPGSTCRSSRRCVDALLERARTSRRRRAARSSRSGDARPAVAPAAPDRGRRPTAAAALLGLGRRRTPTSASFAGRRSTTTRAAARRAPPRRRAADARHRPRDEGPRVRPCRRRRDGGGPLPERPRRRRGRRPRSRAYEEERRLAYVAWTRARRTLTLLYDPAVPSPFLLEAFSAEELGPQPRARCSSRLSSRSRRSIASRNGSVSSAGRRRGPSPWRRTPPGSASRSTAAPPAPRRGAGRAAARRRRPSAPSRRRGRGQEPVGVPRRDEARPRRSPVARAGRPPGERPRAASSSSHPPGLVPIGPRRADPAPAAPAAAAAGASAPSR